MGVVYILISCHGTLDLVYVPELHMMVHSRSGLYTRVSYTLGLVNRVIVLLQYPLGLVYTPIYASATLWYGLCDLVDSPRYRQSTHQGLLQRYTLV